MAIITAEASRKARAKFIDDLKDVESDAGGRLLEHYRMVMQRIVSAMEHTLGAGSAHEADVLAGGSDDMRIAMIRGRASYILGELDKFGAKGKAIVDEAPA